MHPPCKGNALFDINLAASCQRSSLDTVAHLGYELAQPFECWTTSLPKCLGRRGNDIGYLGGFQKGTVDSLLGLELLSQNRHIVVRRHQCI